MTAIGLNSFVSAAHTIPQEGKLTVAEGQVKTHSSTAIAGRLVTWVKQQAEGAEQKQVDQGAFRLALTNHYGKTLGEKAYQAACRACDQNPGTSHSLTSRQVQEGVTFAEHQVLRNESSAVRIKALSEDVKHNPINNLVQNKAHQTVPSFQSEIIETPETNTELLAARADGKYTERNPFHVERELMARLSTEIAGKYDPLLAENATSKAWGNELLQSIYRNVLRDQRPVEKGEALRVSETPHPMKIAVERFEKQVWKYAEQSFLHSLPENAEVAIHDLSRLLNWENFPTLAEQHGVPGIGWDSEATGTYFAANIPPIRDLAIERLIEKREDETFLSSVTVESFNDIIEDALSELKSPQQKHASPSTADHTSHTTKHVRWV
ncbi:MULTISPECIES: hypothetical protein [unclassified Pseudovibrio]|uniref:hypothetical protein n=1 Tax=unclassified Pseudovibrio TaxID=2627060 RepID=UPI0007B2E34E|nr:MULTISPECIES: hypothetical protein [unclassified Pseudovibrio]KZK99983.1 hypothetical protein PsW74_02599 [Pseudovibrio sp. W74]KZL11813.1 hypothetical protein PsAD14_00729 [Pseudovibrio sp. Ad14]